MQHTVSDRTDNHVDRHVEIGIGSDRSPFTSAFEQSSGEPAARRDVAVPLHRHECWVADRRAEDSGGPPGQVCIGPDQHDR